jgi:hypothetical protein
MSVRDRARNLPSKSRFFVIVVLPLIAFAWMLGLLGLIGCPTFLNGKFIYPHADTFWLFQHVTDSPVIFALYAWMGPFLDAFMVYAFIFILFFYNEFMDKSVDNAAQGE